MTRNDSTFFTNEPDHKLLDRFTSILKDVEHFDVLVGYFRFSGFRKLATSLNKVEKIRILVGLNIDQQSFNYIEQQRNQTGQIEMFSSASEMKERFAESVVDEMENAADDAEAFDSVQLFIQYLQSGKLEIRGHPEQRIHAKVYISRFHAEDRDAGRVITGSSNFSHSGLEGNYEFNVELKDKADLEFAQAKFEELWDESIPISDQFVETVNNNTWINDTITPYELYLKFLYEFFKDDINTDQGADFMFLPDGFMELQYQKQAVQSAMRILETYNGVFLADVVGLGKTYISALLAQHLRKGQILVICPPVLIDYWENTFRDFRVPARVISSGKLETESTKNLSKYRYVIVDEAHRFRNEETKSYLHLHTICRGKQVILVSATPLNNRVGDILALIKLFQNPRRSTLPGIPDLQTYFDEKRREINTFEKGSEGRSDAVKRVSKAVRAEVLRHLMVRRTRHEVAKHFSDDMTQQGLFFPEVADPHRLIYKFDAETDAIFKETIRLLKDMRYARYTPRLYLKRQLSEFEAQSQRNMGGFMRSLLVKRLESSFTAFRKTLGRFIESYEKFITMTQSGEVLISQDVDVYTLINEPEEVLRQLEAEGQLDRFELDDFKDDFFSYLEEDLARLERVQSLWKTVNHDPKLSEFRHQLNGNALLAGKTLVFTESTETGQFIFSRLNVLFPEQVMFYSSTGGQHAGQSLNNRAARERIRRNFDPRDDDPADDVRILITTDVLAEGINLHRSNVIVNYDLPWNPTRVLQRVGRINRVGTSHEAVHIFNFFPTAEADEELGLEENITNKIQAFHDMLGEDAKYLVDSEDVSQHGLFGKQVYRDLNDKSKYQGEADTDVEEVSELYYLQQIRDVRDNQPTLFGKLGRLPRKARTGKSTHLAQIDTVLLSAGNTLTFFKQGPLKKFYLNNGADAVKEIDFYEAARLLECPSNTPRLTIPNTYFEQLQHNKAAFTAALQPTEPPKPKGGRSNAVKAADYIRTALRKPDQLTDEDQQYLRDVQKAFREGNLPMHTAKATFKALEAKGANTALQVLRIVRDNVSPVQLLDPPADLTQFQSAPKEIILSAWLTATQPDTTA